MHESDKDQAKIESDFLDAPTPYIIGTIQALAMLRNRIPNYKLDEKTYRVLAGIVNTHKSKVTVSTLTQIIVSFCRGYAEGRAYQDEYLNDRK